MTHLIVVNEPTTNGQRHFGVVFEDGTRMDYSVSTVAELKSRIQTDSDRLDKAADLAAVPVDAPIDTKPDPVIPPTQDEIDKAAYFVARRKLEAARAAVALAGDAGAKIDLASLEVDFVAKFKEDYL